MQITCYHREQVVPWLPTMTAWCLSNFSRDPWLYAPREDLLVNTADTIYVNEKESILILAQEDGKIMALAAGISLTSYYLENFYFYTDIVQKFKEKGFTPDQIFYIGYFLFSPETRHDTNLVLSIYNKMVEFAKTLGKKQISYMDIISKKKDIQQEPWDEIVGGFKSTEVVFDDSWPTIQPDGKVHDQPHKLLFYIKEI